MQSGYEGADMGKGQSHWPLLQGAGWSYTCVAAAWGDGYQKPRVHTFAYAQNLSSDTGLKLSNRNTAMVRKEFKLFNSCPFSRGSRKKGR
jgi:hypothetical protein